RAAQRAPGRSAQPRPEHRGLRPRLAWRDCLPRPGRRDDPPPARARTEGEGGMTAAKKAAPAKKRGLGRGLEALLGPKAAEEAPALEARPGDTLRTLPIDALAPGKYQPRRHMDPAKLTELAESIRVQGVIQPIVVRQLPDRTFEIIAGERRWRASREAGLDEVPVVVREVDDRTVVALALIENLQREDQNPLEEAQEPERLGDDVDLRHAQGADAVGRPRRPDSDLLRP